MPTITDDARHALDAHRKTIEDLHQKLAAMPGINKAKLQVALEKYRASMSQFHDDVLGCMN
jgi:hypothetical protein